MRGEYAGEVETDGRTKVVLEGRCRRNSEGLTRTERRVQPPRFLWELEELAAYMFLPARANSGSVTMLVIHCTKNQTVSKHMFR